MLRAVLVVGLILTGPALASLTDEYGPVGGKSYS